MEEIPPGGPEVAWEDAAAPEESSPAEEAVEVTMVEPLELDTSWVPDYAQQSVDFIQAFATNPQKFQEIEQKMQFLHGISTLCRDSKLYDFAEELNDFCSSYKVADTIQMLLDLEPKNEICTRLRRFAMLAFSGLSTIGVEMDTKKILRLCFNSVFFLRPRGEMPSLEASLYTRAMHSMDIMLEVMVRISPCFSQTLQDVLEILMEFLYSDIAVVKKRAMGKIRLLSRLLVEVCVEEEADEEEEDDDDDDNDDDDDDDDGHPPAVATQLMEIPILGKLLGHLFFKLFRPEETITVVVESLCSLMTFITQQKRATLPEDDVQPPENWKFEINSWVNASSSWKVHAFGTYLRPAERTEVVLEAIEILGRSCFLSKKAPAEFLEEAMKSPEMWLTDVPKVVKHIFKYSNEKNETATQSFHSLLVHMANTWPERVIATALEITPNFSEKINLWKAMFSVRQTLEKVLKELQTQLHDWQSNITQEQKLCISFLSMLACGDILESKVRPLYKDLSLLKSPKMEMVPLVLRALETLSESAETAKKMKGLLPEMLKFLGHWSWDISVMALGTLHNVMGQLKKKEASDMAVEVVNRLWHLFDAKEDCVRERSISLFGELLGKTVWRDKTTMRRNSWKALVQLVLHMSDQVPSVAEASKKAVMAVADFLKWKELKELAEKEQMWKMGECLLAKDSSRAEQFVQDSQPYLLSLQAPMREAALRFIGLAARHLTKKSEDTMSKALLEIGSLTARESDPSIRSLAAQTSLILQSLRNEQKSRFSLRTQCCWRC